MSPRHLPAALVVACLALVACGGDDDTTVATTVTEPAAVTTEPTPATTEAAPVTTEPAAATTEPTPVTTEAVPATTEPATPATTEVAPPTTDVSPLARLQALLLTAADVNALGGGDDVADVGWADENAAEGPCGTPALDTDFPPTAEVGTTLGSSDGQIGLIQQIKIYDTRESGLDAGVYAVEMLGCGTTPDGATTFGEPIDITSQVSTAAVVAPDAEYSITAIDFAASSGASGVGIVAHYNDMVMTFQFVQGPDVSADRRPAEPLDVIAAGLDKVFAAIA